MHATIADCFLAEFQGSRTRAYRKCVLRESGPDVRLDTDLSLWDEASKSTAHPESQLIRRILQLLREVEREPGSCISNVGQLSKEIWKSFLK